MLDVGEDIEVGANDRGRLLLGGDLLAENVDRRQLALGVDAPDRLARVFQLGSGDVTLGELLDDRAGNDRKETDDRAVEDRQECAKPNARA